MLKPEVRTEMEKLAFDLARPVPCRKFSTQPLAVQIKHISSEVSELWEALVENTNKKADNIEQDIHDKERMAEETIDIITACRTFLYMLDYTDLEVECMQVKVNLKNRSRGYWEEADVEK